MNILLASAEVTPFAKVGGLADVAGALPKEWAKLGHNVVIIMPKYGQIDTHEYGIVDTGVIVPVPMGYWTEYAHLWRGTLPGSTVPVYFLGSHEYFDRHGIYGNPEGFDDNDRRFLFFSRAVFEAAKVLNFSPDVVHAHDYHTAMTMDFLKTHYRWDPLFYKTAGVYTIHNMAFHGVFDARKIMHLAQYDQEWFRPLSRYEFYGAINFMKLGILSADKITTVSPSYAHEIRYTSAGEGLQNTLNERGGDVIGVLNGADYSEWNPRIDKLIYTKYTKNFLEGKRINKRKFLQERGVPEHEILRDLPLVGIVSRLTNQKGIDLIEQSLEYFIAEDKFRFAILGSGSERYENYFRYLAGRYSTRVFLHTGYDNSLSHKIVACSDFFLVPSLFEPCGLTQMYALKYGTVPIVRATGGLKDTVHNYNPADCTGNGIVFDNYSWEDFADALRRGLSLYNVHTHWDKIRQNGMAADYSAASSAKNYVQVFEWALEKVR